MDSISQLVDYFLHLDRYLEVVIKSYGVWTYGILFAIVFCETGLVVTPFLPGDSLLFAAGALTATTSLRVEWLVILLCIAAVAGDAVNYAVGHFFGEVLTKRGGRLIKKEHLDRTHRFFERHGKKTIVLARFVPIVRTFAPFVAGLGRMGYMQFAAYNVIGGCAWVFSMVGAGRLFGSIPIVKEYFSLVILAIVVLSVVIPLAVEMRHSKGPLFKGR